MAEGQGGKMRLVSRNPYTGRVMEEFEGQTLDDAVREAEKSRGAFDLWRKTSVATISSLRSAGPFSEK